MNEVKNSTNPASLRVSFDLEVDTMFNPSPVPMSKDEFLKSQDEQNFMFPYSEAFAYDSKAEQLCGEATDEYFRDCLAKIKEAEAAARES